MKKGLLLSLVIIVSILMIFTFSFTGCKKEVSSTGEAKTESTEKEVLEEKEEAKPAEKQLKVAGSLMTLQHPWYLGVEQGLKEVAKENNIDFHVEDAQMDVNTQ
ncbi:MAG: hypothetical protein PHR39_02395, partial [Actinomycetota bacterium]|nr:hypothetical protein [Actinomycetota bacterium]